MDLITPENTTCTLGPRGVALASEELETLLHCYQAVTDPLSYQTARRAVDELKRELMETSGAAPCAERAERLATALARSVCEWVMDREG